MQYPDSDIPAYGWCGVTLPARRSPLPPRPVAVVRQAQLTADVDCGCGRRLSWLLAPPPWVLVCSRCGETVGAELRWEVLEKGVVR